MTRNLETFRLVSELVCLFFIDQGFELNAFFSCDLFDSLVTLSSPGVNTRHLTLTVPRSTQEYKWVLATKCWG